MAENFFRAILNKYILFELIQYNSPVSHTLHRMVHNFRIDIKIFSTRTTINVPPPMSMQIVYEIRNSISSRSNLNLSIIGQTHKAKQICDNKF